MKRHEFNTMRIGVLHNAYRFRGGEDRVAEAEAALLESAGHAVSRLVFDNSIAFASLGPALRNTLRASGGWNRNAGDRIQDWVRRERIDVVHLHNLFPLITGAGVDAIRSIRVPIVATLHNFRAFCAAGTMTRYGSPCNRCTRSNAAPALANGCWAGSRLRTASWLLAQSRARELWSDDRVTFVAPSEHVRDRYREAGFTDARIVVRPHFTDLEPSPRARRCGAVVVGRVEAAKGVLDLVRGWPSDAETLTVVGDGPDCARARAMAGRNIRFTGGLDRAGVANQLGRAKVLLSPSLMPETFGLTLIEAAASETPAVAFRNGGSSSIIRNGESGVLADPGDFRSLIRSAMGLLSNRDERVAMAAVARRRFEALYSPEAGLASLEAVYTRAVGASAGSAECAA